MERELHEVVSLFEELKSNFKYFKCSISSYLDYGYSFIYSSKKFSTELFDFEQFLKTLLLEYAKDELSYAEIGFYQVSNQNSLILTVDVSDNHFYVFAYMKRVDMFYDNDNHPAYISTDISIKTILDDQSPLLISDSLKLTLLSFPEIFE